MKGYQQLAREQRYQIYGLRKASLKQIEIVNKVGVDKSTILQELILFRVIRFNNKSFRLT